MKHLRSSPWFLGGILTVAGVGIVYALRQANACRPKLVVGSRVLLLGDSLGVGLATPLRSISQQSGCEFAATVESGTRIDQWLAAPRWQQAASAFGGAAPTVALVSLGTNDSKGNAPTATLKAQALELRDRLQALGAHVVWVLPPKLPFPDRLTPGLVGGDTDVFLSSSLPLPQVDGIHLTGRGYAGWAEHIWASLTCTQAPPESLTGLGANTAPPVPGFMRRARRRRRYARV